MPSIDDGDFRTPAAKRQRIAEGSGLLSKNGSRIFSPFRTLGLVSPTPVPFTSVPLGKTTFQITTSVGQSLQTYDLRRGLNLVFLSKPQTPRTITATCASKDQVFVAWGSGHGADLPGVWIYKRGQKVGELERVEAMKSTIKSLMAFGSWVVGSTGMTIEIWKSATHEHYTTLTPASGGRNQSTDVVTSICHMDTFLNKIFVGTRNGNVEIWNIGSAKLVYTILPRFPECGPITALQPTPALSLLAIAYENGSLVIQDVRTDTTVLQPRPKSSPPNPIHSISFRTDGLGAGEDGRDVGVMATASMDSGDITMWDLNKDGRVVGILRGAHQISTSDDQVTTGGITKIEFLPGQSVIVSTGLDNALRTWIFDETPFSPIPRPLHSRSGHGAPVVTLKFLPANSDGTDSIGKWILSGAKDRSLWGFSLRKDGQNTEISQGSVQKNLKKVTGALALSKSANLEDFKAPEITCIACSLNRDGGIGAAAGGPVWANAKSKDAEGTNSTGWESIITGHKGDKFARTWFWGKRKAGRWAFQTSDGSEVKSVAVTSCGTFALLGSAMGAIDMYNLQSGLHRQRFPSRLTPAQARKLRLQQSASGDNVLDGPRRFGLGEGKHHKTVTGVMVDPLNKTVISCGLDGRVKFWDFLSGQLQDELDWHPMTAITALRYNDASDLIALSCDDLSIRVVDVETKKLVRELWGCVGQINDFCFSNDGRWVVAASMDSVIRIWDLPTGHLIDAFRTRSTCTALSFSSTGEYLATAHASNLGINIWNNRSLFVHIPTRHISEEEVREISEPSASGENISLPVGAAFDQDSEAENTGAIAKSTSFEQLSQDMLTLSVVPRSRWQTLLHLETVRSRNKPTEPPKAPEKASFFLPSMNTNGNKLVEQFSQADTIHPEAATDLSRISARPHATESPFTTLLHSCSSQPEPDFDLFIGHLKSLSPSAADLEIRSLRPDELDLFVSGLTQRLRKKRDYELINAWMAVFLKVHSEEVVSRAGAGVGQAEHDAMSHSNELVEKLKEWRQEQEKEGKRLSNLVGFCGAVVGWVRSERA